MIIQEFKRIDRSFFGGFLILTCVPSAIFFSSFMLGHDVNETNVIFLSRALRTSFPQSAQVFICAGLLSLCLSHILLVKFVTNLSAEKLDKFTNGSMRSDLKIDKRLHRFVQFLVVSTVSLGSVAMLTFGPVDMSIMCASGACISKSPMLFAVTQTLLLLLIYICNSCIFVLVVAYIKLEKFE